MARCGVRVIFVFIDGVGLGEDDAAKNAFVAHPPPTLRNLLEDTPITAAAAPVRTESAHLLALDARLGVAGVPQSGTGQAALLTGHNAAAEHGRHYGPWVPSRLRALVRERSILERARAAGRSVAFANAYPEEVLRAIRSDPGTETLPSDIGPGRSTPASRFLNAGPPLAAVGAGVLVRDTTSLQRGDAVASEITNNAWRKRLHRDVPEVTARAAGHVLARIGTANELTLFAHYATDYAGHAGRLEVAVEALHRVDEFLAGLFEAMPADAVAIVASDHGNLEDCTAGHTTNPALALAVGHGSTELTADWTAITDVAPAILAGLGVDA